MTGRVADRLAGAQESLRAKVRRERAKLVRRVYPAPEYRGDRVGFSRDVLHFEPWDRQAEWMRALIPEGG
jgi:hypothetical protein